MYVQQDLERVPGPHARHVFGSAAARQERLEFLRLFAPWEWEVLFSNEEGIFNGLYVHVEHP